jgi:protein-S-isoprenylcysteine O-methyltransferase Ste14
MSAPSAAQEARGFLLEAFGRSDRMTALQIVLFVLASVGLVYVSRASLRRPRAHGFFRFWAWEAIVALILLNAPVWFQDPLSWHQILSWILLMVSFIPLALGLRQLRRAERSQEKRRDAELLGFEKTAELITSGIYHFIRHPMYSSLLCLAWGVFFKALTWPSAALVTIATGFLLATARAEERENIRFFGPVYETYMNRTRRFIPFLF